MVRKARISAAQISINDERDIDTHVHDYLKYIKMAAKKGCDIVCFPETSLYASLDFLPPQEQQLMPYLDTISKACLDNRIWAIATSYVAVGEKRFNRSYLINRQGKIVYEYDKIHLWPTERPLITNGVNNHVIKTDFGNIALITCFDTFFPECIRNFVDEDVEIIFCPTYWVEYDTDKLQTNKVHGILGTVRAYENMAYFVMCDPFFERTISCSYISSPIEKVSEISNREGLIVADVDFDYLKRSKEYLLIPSPYNPK